MNTNEETRLLVQRATAGDRAALEEVLGGVQDLVFNLSLRMLGTFPDAEDASQEILLRVMTHLSSFRGESAFSTWVFRIAANYLSGYRKHLFAQRPLSFEFYGEDIKNGAVEDLPDLSQDVSRELLAEELKLSCTNVMLQCLDTESRCAFILGTMFRLDSAAAGEVLGISPENYRQRLSRARKRMAAFLEEYCGEYSHGECRCARRVDYAIQCRRISKAGLHRRPAGQPGAGGNGGHGGTGRRFPAVRLLQGLPVPGAAAGDDPGTAGQHSLFHRHQSVRRAHHGHQSDLRLPDGPGGQ